MRRPAWQSRSSCSCCARRLVAVSCCHECPGCATLWPGGAEGGDVRAGGAVAGAAADAPQSPQTPRVTFGEVFASGEFRAVWLAHLASIAGDQFARVALTVLVYQRTGSPLLTALTYAASYLSWIVGGLGLAGLADRYPRRAVMIVSDIVRMVLVAAMVLPGGPLGALVALLFAVTALNAPFQGARSALRATSLPGDRYALG